MDSLDFSKLSLYDSSCDISNQFERLNLKEEARNIITWDITLYANYERDQFIFIIADYHYNLEEKYNWTKIGDLELTFFYDNDLIHTELLYTSFIEIERWPYDFYSQANIYHVQPDFSLLNLGFIDVVRSDNFLYENSLGEITLFEDPLYGRPCRLSLIILK